MQTASTAPHGDSAAPCPAERVRAGSSAGGHQHQRGLFLTFEGIDGAGKSSHISSLADEFRRRGAQVVQTREPGGTPLAETLRGLVLNEPMDALTEALLMFAARRDHIHQVIAPALAAGSVVICDRFTDSTFAYQGGGRGFDLVTLTALERMVQDVALRAAAGRAAPGDTGDTSEAGDRAGGPAVEQPTLLQPDLTILFDLEPGVAAERLAGAREPDRFERQPVDFFGAVSRGYAARRAADPGRFAIYRSGRTTARARVASRPGAYRGSRTFSPGQRKPGRRPACGCPSTEEIVSEATKTQQALLEAMQAGIVIHQCWTPGTGMFYFWHDNLKACTSAGLALIRKGVARTQGTGSDKTLVLVDQSAAASLSAAGTAGAVGGQAQA